MEIQGLSEAPAAPETANRVPPPSEGQENVKVLLVDDHPHKLTALESVLADGNLNVVQAKSGEDALRQLLRDDFAVILLDVHMPALDGFQTAALIRQRKRSEHTPIIFITANTVAETQLSRGYALGAVDFIASPVVPEILKAKVEVFVDLFRATRTVQRQATALKLYSLDLELANRKLGQKTQELQTSRENFRSIVERNSEGIAVVDAQGGIRFANPSLASLLGVPLESMLGRTFPFPLRPSAPLELEPGAWEGLQVPAELSLAETVWAGEKAYLATLQDISRRRKAEAALRTSEEMLRQAQRLESVGRLAGGIAHDFNNLLTATSGYTSLLLDALEPGSPLRDYVLEIRRSGDRAAELTHRLLAYSRKQVLIPKPLNLNALVENMTNMLRRVIGDDVELDLIPDPALGWVLADPGQLEQMIMNLVVNAKDAMPSGGRITLRTSMERLEPAEENADPPGLEPPSAPGQYAVLSVSDSGVGMDEATRLRIFEPFFTTKEVGKGTGLGLSMVYGFVKQSGGQIAVESAPGRGSCFKVFFPVSGGLAAVKAPEGEGRDRPGGTETILLVEDHHTVRKFMRSVLRQSGYRILEAQDGQEALDLAQAFLEPIHLLLTDVMMPHLRGTELADLLVVQRPEMKVLFMSGYSEEIISQNGRTGPRAQFLQKPFSPAQLANKVREVLMPAVTA